MPKIKLKKHIINQKRSIFKKKYHLKSEKIMRNKKKAKDLILKPTLINYKKTQIFKTIRILNFTQMNFHRLKPKITLRYTNLKATISHRTTTIMLRSSTTNKCILMVLILLHRTKILKYHLLTTLILILIILKLFNSIMNLMITTASIPVMGTNYSLLKMQKRTYIILLQ